MSYIITTSNLSKGYPNTTAVDSVDLHVEEGAVYGLIGRNGAGKTTLLRMLSGLSRPSAGEIEFGRRTDGKKPRIGVLIEDPGLYNSLSAVKNLEIKRIALHAPGGEERSRELLRFVGLENWADVRTGSFSPGMRQRLAIALALTGDPDIVILDEPLNGLDPQGLRDIRLILQRLHEERKTIIISSHQLSELSKFATVYGIMEQGRLVKEASEEEILETMPGYVRLIVDDTAAAKKVLEEMNIFSYQTKSSHMIHVLEQLGRQDEMLDRMEQAGIHVHECRVIRDSLEDYFIGITRGGSGR